MLLRSGTPSPTRVLANGGGSAHCKATVTLSVIAPERLDPFNGFFRNHGPRPVPPDGLLDLPVARRWFSLLSWGDEEGLYTYQMPLEGRTGTRARVLGRSRIMLSCYDYLGLAGHPAVEEAAIAAVRTYGTGTGGVRMLTGTTVLHRDLESEIAAFKDVGAALAFGSGYLANLAVVAALFGPRDRVLLDARAHRSLHDACVLARVPVTTFPHNDVAALERELRREPARHRTLIVVDGLYSMDGDLCPLPELVELKRRYGAFLLVDEAHAMGVLGATGRGVHEHFGIAASAVDIWTGSLSKAVPSNGGFVAGRRDLIVYLQHAAAPFWFSAALGPAAAGAALEALRVARREPERLEAQRRNAEALRLGLRARGYDTGNSASAIVPVLVGEEVAAWRLARRLFDEGVLVSAVVHPAVPRGAARLRLCATAAQSAADLDEALEAFDRAGRPADPR
ncbi:MAG TPA: pyridoxal phosphate-dependent aminotransferase family protein [Candidatus Polarisedimenticolia bacterium]|jgi:glycine C-acetyltransferase|nr:pyridoxal phosphate-dependent aminotransferase family protein [Candidatus Polarisedimenticolia bacterium]